MIFLAVLDISTSHGDKGLNTLLQVHFGDDTQNDFEKEYDISVKIKIAN